ncbi:hypothetical protein CRI94_10755 [Longibacter salinarum]|uniref:Serine kinase n=1 Tax=Longibacter salinarum TaxID=1850348 RepID=A0A2A8CWY1_9BACT|nr:hypothetical protein [Longibacter salinarum]PEN13121.1 hypothetical protein CRI94_10755 [Longibacter salinarum]
MTSPSIYRAYGITLESTYPFRFSLSRASGAPDVRIRVVDESPRPDFWDGARPVHIESQGEDGLADAIFLNDDIADIAVLRFASAADIYIGRETIACHLKKPHLTDALEVWLFGPVLAIWLERRGVLALHAASVSVDGAGIGMLATSQSGKSTLAAAMMERGHPLLTDDILAVTTSASGPVAQPGYPQMRLWSDQVQRWVGEADLPRVVPHLDKRRVPVGVDGFGTFQSDPVPLRALLIPERGPDAQDVAFRRLSPTEAIMECIRHSFLPQSIHALGLSAQRQEALATLVRTVPAYACIYPDGLDRVSEVVDAIEQQVRLLAQKAA